VTLAQAGFWSALWVVLSLTFGFVVYRVMGHKSGLEFVTGYVIEYALSVDNIFVFLLIFNYFQVPAKYQQRVLLWGILGALLLRGAMIGLGAALVTRFEWLLYVFGAFLVYTGAKMALQKDEAAYDPEGDPVFRMTSRVIPLTREYHEQHFFVELPDAADRTRRHATPLFLVLIVLSTTDIVFATDSIPAIFAITRDPFIVYTSNICAVLGLRALYFLLADMMDRFRYLKIGLSLVLVFIGIKMLIEELFHIPIAASLGVVAAILALSVILSLARPQNRTIS
jgi:tellurite resistance protein TerC